MNTTEPKEPPEGDIKTMRCHSIQEMTQMVRAPAPRRRATSGSPEETMVTPTRRERQGNVTGAGRKVTSKEIEESPKEAPAIEDPETTRRIALTATSRDTKNQSAGRSIQNRS